MSYIDTHKHNKPYTPQGGLGQGYHVTVKQHDKAPSGDNSLSLIDSNLINNIKEPIPPKIQGDINNIISLLENEQYLANKPKPISPSHALVHSSKSEPNHSLVFNKNDTASIVQSHDFLKGALTSIGGVLTYNIVNNIVNSKKSPPPRPSYDPKAIGQIISATTNAVIMFAITLGGVGYLLRDTPEMLKARIDIYKKD